MTDEKDEKDERPQIEPDPDHEPDHEPDWGPVYGPVYGPDREPDDGGEPVDGRLEEVPEKQQSDEESRRKRVSGAGVLIGVLLALLGFAFVVQIRSNTTDNSYAALRESDLLQILSDLDSSERRLNQDIASLQQTKQELQSGAASRDAALAEAKARADELGILAGTLKAQGPGLMLQFVENTGSIQAGTLLNAVQELRGAGAEAIQFGTVRVSTSTSFTGGNGRVDVDGTELTAPYRVTAIGDAKTLDTALNIPGGVAATVRAAGGELSVTEQRSVTIKVTRTLPTPKYAKPAH